MNNQLELFKPWVPRWLVKVTIFIAILPAVVSFALSVANVNAAAGYYGIEPNDVQYSLIILYGAMAGFFALEGRFSKNIAGKQYLLIGIMLQMVTSYLCFITHELLLLCMVRFLQGVITCGSISIILTIMFSQLHSERSREIGYSVVYGILLCIIPFTTIITASIIDTFDYNVVYKCAIYSYLPGAVLVYLVMNNVRLNKKIPMYQIDWPNFVIYAFGLALIGYVLVYGQQYDWLQDMRILKSVIAIVILFIVLIIRQLHLKRSYLQFHVFKYRNFRIGAFLLFIFYVCRGSFGITTNYLGTVLGMDPFHIGYLMIYNIVGILISVVIASRLVLLKTSMRLILVYGFGLLLIFNVMMYFLFQGQNNSSVFIIPLVLQGIGSGMLMVPIILFMVSSVPPKFSPTASAVGIFFRFSGFCSSIALINYFQLYNQNNHYNRFQEQLSVLNPIAVHRLNMYKQALVARGMAADRAGGIANGLLVKRIAVQAQIRSAMDYYQLISCVLLIIILLVVLIPSINKTVINVRSNQPVPIAY